MAHLEKIAIIGAGGRVGGAFAEELMKTGKHQVTAITRPESKSKLPSGLEVVQVDYSDDAALEAALKGQQVLIITLSVRAPQDLHSRLVRAAGRAGVSYIIPNAYGSDITNEALASSTSGDLYTGGSVQKCQEINQAGSSYICVVCGFWFEWSLVLGESWFGFNIKDRTVTFFDDGKTKINTSTWEQCGRAVAALLSLPESGASPSISDWKNKPFYFDSYLVSQRDMLDGLNRVLGTTDGDWTIKSDPTEERYKNGLVAMKNGDMTGFARAMYSRIFFQSGDGNYGQKHGLANDILKLPKEEFDASVKRAIEMVNEGYNPFVE